MPPPRDSAERRQRRRPLHPDVGRGVQKPLEKRAPVQLPPLLPEAAIPRPALHELAMPVATTFDSHRRRCHGRRCSLGHRGGFPKIEANQEHQERGNESQLGIPTPGESNAGPAQTHGRDRWTGPCNHGPACRARARAGRGGEAADGAGGGRPRGWARLRELHGGRREARMAGERVIGECPNHPIRALSSNRAVSKDGIASIHPRYPRR